MPSLVDEVLGVLADVAGAGYTTLLVEQNVDLARSVSDRAYVVERGRIAHETSAAERRDGPGPIDRYLGVGFCD